MLRVLLILSGGAEARTATSAHDRRITSLSMLLRIGRARLFPKAKGLVLHEEVLSSVDRDALFGNAVRLSDAITALSTDQQEMISHNHNVNSKEMFRRVVKDGISCEHFESYGDGHALTYFRGALPFNDLGLDPSVLDVLSDVREVQQEVERSRTERQMRLTAPLKWRLTLNVYRPTAVRQVESNNDDNTDDGSGAAPKEGVGFPWHRDIEANGACTMILTLGAPAQLQFGWCSDGDGGDGLLYDDDVTVEEEATIEPGCLLLLTGPARWDMVHRVLPPLNAGLRASLVLGCW